MRINLFMNKKADERILSIYLFIIYIIVSIGIISGVLVFYGSVLDVREPETDILINKIIDCSVQQGELNEEILNEKFNLVDFCRLDFKDNTKLGNEEGQYFVKINLFNFSSCSKNENKLICSEKIKEISAGRTDFSEFCSLAGEKIPKCQTKEIYILNSKKKFLLQIIAGIGKVQANT